MTNMSSPRRPARLARQFALAMALAAGTAVLAVPGFADAAYAQKKKKGEEEAEAAGKPVYTPAFVKAYQPLDAKLKAPGASIAALKPEIDALVPLAVTPDDKLALGGMLFNAGITGKDLALQLQGAETMLASGKTKPEDTGRYNVVAFQIANDLKQYDKARSYLQKAIDLNYSGPNVTVADLQMNMAELYFIEGRNEEGLTYLSQVIAQRKAAGQPVDAKLYRRGVSVSYQNEIVPQIYEFVEQWVADYPTPENWRDAVNLTRNLNDFDGPVLLDLLRLGKKVGTLKEKNDYIFYVESADPRRLPQEVVSVIDDAYATGVIPKGSDSWIEEQYKSANGLIAADKAALSGLERDANAPTAKLRTVMAAGDTFLSYGEYAKAAAFYEKSLTLADADRDTSLTRLGIAQIGAGNVDAAIATFKQVSGQRAPIARLWSAYAEQQTKPAMAAATGS
ncbi:tetratricopeptide repeat protein [Erythrobacter donghaensis]|uniref:tetratricopeptide repeat protein n=1 Tax=Erythrobacter donghaensis TaxID=267135 RepID=UPI000AF6BC19|nr:tetratricopeptide repeat protein [Erythrobacter donghaensis]